MIDDDYHSGFHFHPLQGMHIQGNKHPELLLWILQTVLHVCIGSSLILMYQWCSFNCITVNVHHWSSTQCRWYCYNTDHMCAESGYTNHPLIFFSFWQTYSQAFHYTFCFCSPYMGVELLCIICMTWTAITVDWYNSVNWLYTCPPTNSNSTSVIKWRKYSAGNS